MIARLRGQVWEKLPPNIVVIDANGVGYEVEVPISTFSMLPAVKSEASLYIKQIAKPNMAVDELIKIALQSLMKK